MAGLADASMRVVKAFQVMSRPVVTVTPAATVKEAARLLADHDISALPVVDGRGHVVGIVSEADLLGLGTRPDPRSQATPLPRPARSAQEVSEVMTRDVICLPDDTDVGRLATTMLAVGIKAIPILRDGRLVGIVSRRDLIKLIGRDDDAIQHDVHTVLSRQGLAAAGVKVDVRDGTAVIGGGFDPGSRALLELLVRAVPGVLDVTFEAESAPAPA